MLLLLMRFEDEAELNLFLDDAEIEDDEYAVVVMDTERMTVQ